MSCVFFFSSRRRHTRCSRDWSSDVATIELVAKFREVFEESNRPWILRPERRLIDQERALIEILRATILTLTGHCRRRVGESSAHEDIRRAERLLHEKRHSSVENLG